MNSNRRSDHLPEGLQALAADIDDLAAQDVEGLPDAALAEEVLALRRLLDRLEGRWLKGLAAVDGRGAAGADQGTPAPSTASWLRARLRMGANAATSWVRTARALFRGPLTTTAQALCDGELSVAHASALAHGTHHLPTHVAAEAEPILVDAARRLDPPRLRRLVAHLLQAVDPDAADRQAERRYGRRGLWVAPTLEGMIALQGLLDPEAGQTLLVALEPLARPDSADDARSGDQRRADALVELARRNLEAGQLPQTGGVRPQLNVTVDLDSLLGHPGALGGEVGGAGPLSPEACRRLACDGAVTRVLVTRHPTGHHPGDHADLSGHPGGDPGHPGGDPGDPGGDPGDPGGDPGDLSGHPGDHGDPNRHHAHEPSGHRPHDDGGDQGGLAQWLQTAMALLPPILGGAPQPAAGPGPGHPGRLPRPAQRPRGPRRRLCVPQLHPAAFVVRGPPPVVLGRRRPHRPGQSGPGVPGPSSDGA
jgi:Domain of unknown function (DUF222)